MTDIEVVTRIAAAPSVVFDLELDTAVHSASLAATGETSSTSTGEPVLGLGDEVTLRARHFGLPWTLTSRVTAYERPTRFVDEQVRGPLAAVRHEHVFDLQPDGSTLMTDRMSFRAPSGPLGQGASLLLRPYVRRLLPTRARYIKAAAEGAMTRSAGRRSTRTSARPTPAAPAGDSAARRSTSRSVGRSSVTCSDSSSWGRRRPTGAPASLPRRLDQRAVRPDATGRVHQRAVPDRASAPGGRPQASACSRPTASSGSVARTSRRATCGRRRSRTSAASCTPCCRRRDRSARSLGFARVLGPRQERTDAAAVLYRVLESSPGEQVAAVLTTSDEPPQEFVCPDDVAAQRLAAELYEVSLWLPGPDHLTADPVAAWAWVRRFMGLQRPVP